jgi:hypothetical protein
VHEDVKDLGDNDKGNHLRPGYCGNIPVNTTGGAVVPCILKGYAVVGKELYKLSSPGRPACLYPF